MELVEILLNVDIATALIAIGCYCVTLGKWRCASVCAPTKCELAVTFLIQITRCYSYVCAVIGWYLLWRDLREEDTGEADAPSDANDLPSLISWTRRSSVSVVHGLPSMSKLRHAGRRKRPV